MYGSNNTISKLILTICLIFAFNCNAHALVMTAKCVSTGARSRFVLTGPGALGAYWGIFKSGEMFRKTGYKSANSVGMATFVFDSDPAAIRAGATPIPANFTKNGQLVFGYMRKAVSNVSVGGIGAICRPK